MPSYQYKCKKCNLEKIIVCKMSEYSPTTTCDCGEEMERKIDDLVCGMSVDKTNSFYRTVN